MIFKSLVCLSAMALTSAFTGVTVVTPAPAKDASTRHMRGVIVVQQQELNKPNNGALSALIYGWDNGSDDDDDDDDDDDTSAGALTYSDDYYDSSGEHHKQCSPAGVAVAEALSYDPDRVGSLARLAVAFSPPEHALSLDTIENVEVVCVREDHIDIQAIICEEGGCVSVAVPIQFPFSCDSHTEWLEGCVRRNLEELDETASTTLLRIEDADGNNDEDLCILDSSVDFPSWWVPPSCDEAMAAECTLMRSILNKDEFQRDIIALAQDSLNHASDNGEGSYYAVTEAKVAAIGPAGLCFKVRAECRSDVDRPTHILDVMYPFGGEPLDGAGNLRAAVLGIVATAEGTPEM